MRALTLAEIAGIRASKGELDVALAFYAQALEAFEALGDERSRAVTLGNVAGVRASTGNLREALDLYEQALRAFEALGDEHARAVTLSRIAQIAAAKRDDQTALEQLGASYALFEKLGDVQGICDVGLDLASLRLATGHASPDTTAILARSRDGFLRLGQKEKAEQAQALLDRAATPGAPDPPPSR